MLLKGKTALITGASRGIGRASAFLFAEHGAHLILLARSVDHLNELKSEIQTKYSVEVHIFSVDISNEDQVKYCFKEIFNQKLSIHVLLNNAGILKDGLFLMVKSETIEEIYRTNVFGLLSISQHAIKSMMRTGGGSIVNISSIVGTNGNVGQVAYASSKTAVVGITKSLAKELAQFNIRVNAIAPGLIDTDMTRGLEESTLIRLKNSIGMKRMGAPEDIANVALFLASDLSTYVTGEIIGVHGGMVI